MRFKLIQRKDENGDLLNEADVYVCTGKDWLIFDHWTLLEDGMVVMRDAPQPRYPGKSVFDSHSDTGAAGKYAYAYTNACYQPSADGRYSVASSSTVGNSGSGSNGLDADSEMETRWRTKQPE